MNKMKFLNHFTKQVMMVPLEVNGKRADVNKLVAIMVSKGYVRGSRSAKLGPAEKHLIAEARRLEQVQGSTQDLGVQFTPPIIE